VPQQQRQNGDDALEEQVEEEDAAGAAEQAVDDQRHLAGQSSRSRHAVTCSHTERIQANIVVRSRRRHRHNAAIRLIKTRRNFKL